MEFPFKVDVAGVLKTVQTTAELADVVAVAISQGAEATKDDGAPVYTSFYNAKQNNRDLRYFGLGLKPLEDGTGDFSVYDITTEEVYASGFIYNGVAR